MRFGLFGFPVHVSWTFALTAAILGAQRDDLVLIGQWVLVVFVSVIVHELGHAFAARAYGGAPAISLHYMGGHTSFELRRESRGPTILISLAGPVAGFLFGAGVYLAQIATGVFSSGSASVLYRDLLWVNLGWGLVNLVPTLPLDGGHILEALVRRPRRVLAVSLGVSLVVSALALWSGYLWAALLFGVFAYQQIADLRAMPKGPSISRVPLRSVISRSRGAEPEWAREARRRAREGKSEDP